MVGAKNAPDISRRVCQWRQLSYLLFVAPIAAWISDCRDFIKAKLLRHLWKIQFSPIFTKFLLNVLQICKDHILIGHFPLISTYPAFRSFFCFIFQRLGASVWCRHGWRFEAEKWTQAFFNLINLAILSNPHRPKTQKKEDPSWSKRNLTPKFSNGIQFHHDSLRMKIQ